MANSADARRRLALIQAAGFVCLLTSTALIPERCIADDFPPVKNSPSEADLLPMPADEAAAKMKLPDGFRATVFAAEPEVQNPIGMAWDDRGRLWIAENYTYSDRFQHFDLSMRDRVLIFEDLDNDGRADRRKVFTDQVQMLTSVETGRGGVWLMCPPQLLFIPDENGDDIPDGSAQVMLDGFDVSDANYHNFANGLRWGPDGWLYGRCGHSCPGRPGVPGTPVEQRVPIDGGIWRFHPGKNIVEVLTHGTVNPWGHDWDEHGELFFINTVIGHLWHALPGSHFKESFGESDNPGVYQRMDMIADHYHFDTRGNWSDSRGGKANDLGGGHAHIGMLIYQGRQWPDYYRNKLLTLNMHGLRANVERLERSGSGYVGRHEPDFFISPDPFFRGIDLSTGPDGNVYVIDWSDTGECHEHTGVHRLSGRIFKISHGPTRTNRPVVKPACLQADTALAQLWRDYQSGKTTPESLRQLEQHPDEHVRVWAIRLLTDFWPLDHITGPSAFAVYPDDPATRQMLVRMAQRDSSGLVHRVLASTLQRLPVQYRLELGQALMRHDRHADDDDLAMLVWFGMIPVSDRSPEEIAAAATTCRWPLLMRFISRSLTVQMNQNPAPLNSLLVSASGFQPELQLSVLRGMHDAMQGWRRAAQPQAWPAFIQSEALADARETIRELATLFGDGRALDELRLIATDSKRELSVRERALQSLIDARPDDLRVICESLLDARVLNATAARGLSLFDDPAVSKLLASKYRRFQPSDRAGLLETLTSRPESALALLDQIEAGQVPVADLTAAHARQIHNLGNEVLSSRLSEVWGELRDSPAERVALISQLKDRLDPATLAQADRSNGRLLFNKTCSQCHRLFGEGLPIGPDLTGAQRSSLDYLLSNIVDPSAVVGKDHRLSIVALTDGRVLNGLIVSKTPETMTLQTATKSVTLTTDEIETIKTTSQSAMPDGLLQNLSEEQIRDLIGYLMSPVQVALPAAE